LRVKPVAISGCIGWESATNVADDRATQAINVDSAKNE
jgi:hypothetical protein